jgi:hypothetical protein
VQTGLTVRRFAMALCNQVPVRLVLSGIQYRVRARSMKLRILLMAGLLLPLAACSLQIGGDRGGWGPPAHAPAYGHPKYPPPPYGEWRWDDDLRVYVILGYPHLYYRDRIYYRWHDNGWYWSDKYSGPWKGSGSPHKKMPSSLHKKYPPGKKGRG